MDPDADIIPYPDSYFGIIFRRRRSSSARSAAAPLHGVDPAAAEATLAEELRLLDEQAYGRYLAFSRGFLRGGKVDHFFTQVLPKLDLGEHAIRRALVRDMPAAEVLEAELLGPLRAWGERLAAGLTDRLRRLARGEALRQLEIEERVLGPIEDLAGALDALAGLGRAAAERG